MLPAVPCATIRRATVRVHGEERRLQVEPHDGVPRLGRRRHEWGPRLILDPARDVQRPCSAPLGDLVGGQVTREALGIAHVDDP